MQILLAVDMERMGVEASDEMKRIKSQIEKKTACIATAKLKLKGKLEEIDAAKGSAEKEEKKMQLEKVITLMDKKLREREELGEKLDELNRRELDSIREEEE